MNLCPDEVETFRPDQLAHFEHLLRSWYGWELGKTGFIMPTDEQRQWIRGRVMKAVRATLRNKP